MVQIMSILLEELDNINQMRTVINRMNNECSNYLSTGKQLVFRGLKRSIEIPTQITPRTDRKPTDANTRAAAIFNFLFDQMFNVRNIRMRAVFCTHLEGLAEVYGTKYAVVPSNGFEAFQAGNERDSIVTMDAIYSQITHHEIDNDPEDMFASPADLRYITNQRWRQDDQVWVEYLYNNGENKHILREFLKTVQPIIESKSYRKVDFTDATKSQGEIMLVCSHYYIVPDELSPHVFPERMFQYNDEP